MKKTKEKLHYGNVHTYDPSASGHTSLSNVTCYSAMTLVGSRWIKSEGQGRMWHCSENTVASTVVVAVSTL